MARKTLSASEIADLLKTPQRGRRKIDSSEPRTPDNWWKQTHRMIYRPDYPDLNVKCTNPDCKDPRPEDATILLGEIKGTLMCRYCFLNGYLSNEN